LAGDSVTTRVALFCEGRGSATIIRELLRTPEVHLALLVNAYDDGLSTGALRNFIPGMLGPSDLRKNFSYLLDLHSVQQYALKNLLEFRLPADFAASHLDGLVSFVRTGDARLVAAPLGDLFTRLDSATSEKRVRFAQGFSRLRQRSGAAIRFSRLRDRQSSFRWCVAESGWKLQRSR
jgi:hypothetical protein